MPKLKLSLRGKDYAFLRAVANGWDIDLTAPDAYTAVPQLVDAMCQPGNIRTAFGRLPDAARSAIEDLLAHEGRVAWGQFTRDHGELRQMGASKRARERPELNPVSPVELLWYRGMIAKAFFDLPPEPQEFAYIPDELIETFSELCRIEPFEWGRPATPGEQDYPLLVNDAIIDYATDYLAAHRIEMEMNAWSNFRSHWPEGMEAFLRGLLYADYLLDELYNPDPEKIKGFLMSTRGAALGELAKAWLRSQTINELKLLPSIEVDEDIDNNPFGTRKAVLDLLSHVPQGQWWNIQSFIEAVHERQPDFQRPGGNYRAWHIKDRETSVILSGFEDWHEVDGALLYYFITGPMHWLGYFDLSSNSPDGKPLAFRHSSWAQGLWGGAGPKELVNNEGKITVGHAGMIQVPVDAPRWLRYQIARFTDWHKVDGSGERLVYQFRVTPKSLRRANTQGLKPSQLVKLLQLHVEEPPPQGFEQAVENWEKGGTQALIQSAKLLRFSDPQALVKLKQSDAAHLIHEELNDTTVLVNASDAPELVKMLTEMGILVNEE